MKELLRLLGYARRYWPHLLASVVLMAGVGAAHGMVALLIGPAVDGPGDSLAESLLSEGRPGEPKHRRARRK